MTNPTPPLEVTTVRRLAVLLALGLALIALPAYADDDGSGCRYPQPYIEQIYGDTAR